MTRSPIAPLSLIVSTLVVILATSALVAGDRGCSEPTFRRGDSNQDGNLDISDGVFDLNALFTGGSRPACADAADGNDDGNHDIADAVFKFGALFVGGLPPPAPGPDRCGPDPTPDRLGCERYEPCKDEPTPCTSNECCDGNEYCARNVGDCGGTGRCQEIPAGCPDVWDPVCGCDGLTYGNSCEAAAAGVSVLRDGECDLDDCATNADCPRNSYCRREDGECDGEGLCEPRPRVCREILDPVCGCDGLTYGNSCEAAAAGVSVLRDGECGEEDCVDNTDCARGDLCLKEASDCEGRGRCARRPNVCPRILDPVCGCDQRTYANECLARAAGVSVLRPGDCEDSCSEAVDCPRGSYCARDRNDCDGPGACRPRPPRCPDVLDPVCGCDGLTYGNPCEAAAAGVNLEHRGACE